jgi:hypothetical protein
MMWRGAQPRSRPVSRIFLNVVPECPGFFSMLHQFGLADKRGPPAGRHCEEPRSGKSNPAAARRRALCPGLLRFARND